VEIKRDALSLYILPVKRDWLPSKQAFYFSTRTCRGVAQNVVTLPFVTILVTGE
jgi:hypothetical protein